MQQNCASEHLKKKKKNTKTLLLLNPGEVGRGWEMNLINFSLLKKSVIYYLKAIILTGVIGMRHAGILVLAHLY